MSDDTKASALADLMREAEKLVAAGTKERLVISQDTSAYGVDLRHASYPLKSGGEVRAHMTDLARELEVLRDHHSFQKNFQGFRLRSRISSRRSL